VSGACTTWLQEKRWTSYPAAASAASRRVALTGGRSGVVGVPVRLGEETLLGPQEVDLVTVKAGVDRFPLTARRS